MEVQKTKSQKFFKLKVRPDSILEKVSQKLELLSQVNEFSIDIQTYTECADLFTVLSKHLQNQQELTSLCVSFLSLKKILLDDTLYKLQDLKQLTQIQLTFAGDTHISKASRQSMSSYLSQFPLLTTLRLNLYNDFIDIDIELSEFYETNTSLKKVEFQFSVNNSNTLVSLMEGLRHLKKLESFSFNLLSAPIAVYSVLDIIEEELRESSNIKEIEFRFGWRNTLTQHDYKRLGRILEGFKKLEKLTISSSDNINVHQGDSFGFEDNISSLPQLKELFMSTENNRFININQMANKIGLMSSLTTVKLELSLNTLAQVENDIVQFGKSLARIQNLVQLKLDFAFELQLLEVLVLISQFKPVSTLQELSVNIFCERTLEQEDNLNNFHEPDLFEVIGNLKKLNLLLYIPPTIKDQKAINSIYSSIENALQLEHLDIAIPSDSYENLPKQQLMLKDIFNNKTNLQSINLKFDLFFMLDENHLLNVFEKLQQNPKLSEISFTFNNNVSFGNQLLKKLSESLIQLKQLNKLKLIFDKITPLNDEGIIIFVDSFSSFKALKTFKLIFSKNWIKQKTLNYLMSSLHQMEKLKNLSLNVQGDQFTNNEDEKCFGDSFKLPSKLTTLELNLEIKNLKYSNMKNLLQNISQLSKVEQLYLKVKLESYHEDCKEIHHYLSSLKNLQALSFDSYSFSMLYLLSLIDQLPNLMHMSFENYSILAYRSFSVNNLQQICSKGDEEPFLSQETQLNISHNKLLQNESYEKENAEEIVPFVFKSLRFLTYMKIYISEENFIGADFSSVLFKNIFLVQNLSKLKIIIKEENQVGSDCLNDLGASLVQLKSLKQFIIDIQFDKNSIIPSECSPFYSYLSKLSQLEQLVVVFNFGFNQNGNNINFYNKETTQYLLQSIQNLINLKELSLVITELVFDDKLLSQFDQLFSSLKFNLISLELFIRSTSNRDEEILKSSLQQLKNLLIMKTNLPFQIIHKLKKLICFVQLQYYSHN